MFDRPPGPPPLLIELDENRFILNPRTEVAAARSAGAAAVLAMTPEERLHWHERWRQFIKAFQRRGASIELIAAAVYGTTPSDEPG